MRVGLTGIGGFDRGSIQCGPWIRDPPPSYASMLARATLSKHLNFHVIFFWKISSWIRNLQHLFIYRWPASIVSINEQFVMREET
jgi:hypothetical protein